MNNLYEKFTNLYSVSKTLRFELKPQGRTLEHLKANGVIESDEIKSEAYKKVKKMMDEYHKKFINRCLSKYHISESLLLEYSDLLKDRQNNKKEIEKAKEEMRKGISGAFTKDPEYNKLFGKEIIEQILPNEYREDFENTKNINEFTKFVSYFYGFFENRKNMYVAEEKPTAIANRLIEENLPMFISNMQLYDNIKDKLGRDVLIKLHDDLSEILQVENLDEMFSILYFNDVLTQKGIDVYNYVIGGWSKEDGTKLKGLNEYINEYRQTHPEDKSVRKLSELYKQILSESNTPAFVLEKISEDRELINKLNALAEIINENILKDNRLKNLLNAISCYDLSKIYIKNSLALTEISNKLYDDWNVISSALRADYDSKNGEPKTEKEEEKKKNYLKSKKYLSMEYINSCLKEYGKDIYIQKYFSDAEILEENKNNIDVFEEIAKKYNKLQDVLANRYTNEKSIKNDEIIIASIKDYLDTLKALQLFIKPLVSVRFENEYEKDAGFYDKLFEYWDAMEEITPIYNQTRNYLTGKPYSTNKIKLNFGNPQLANGWDVNKERDYKSILLKKDENYYLGIINSNFRGLIKREENLDSNCYEKVEYKLLPGPNKMLPKVFFARSNIEFYNPSKELLAKYDKGCHKKGENFDIGFCHELIDFFKASIQKHEDWSTFHFEFSDTNTYEDISQFYKEVQEQGYKLTFSKVSEAYIENLIEEGQLYLFQIYNKDFSEKSKGNKNLHTLYWKMLFEENNLKNVVYKLNGEAELFYRKASLERKITHPKNQEIKNKNELNKKLRSKFEYDLIKDKRYTEDKFLFHVPITLNFVNESLTASKQFNRYTNLAIKANDENYVIGIDRGERHLLYYSLIDSKGHIVEHDTLNIIKNTYNDCTYETNYHELLDTKEKERDKARKSWQSIEDIKNLKEGYLSQVINKLTDLMIKYNAIVVLEDLNFGFMRGRQKVEKQVYQKFEKMLIDKLNFLAKKNIDVNKPGGLLHAYQLTNKFESFQKLGKQSGVLYYIPAWNTSKLDPTTGFVNLFYLKYESEKKAIEFCNKIDDIRYNKKENYFEFDIDYNNFTTKAEGTKTKWTLCTFGDRIETRRDPNNNSQWTSNSVVLVDKFKELFNENNIDINSNDLKAKILKVVGKKFWESFINLFKLMLQMRNSMTGTDTDYLISPVKNNKGEFYVSGNDQLLPKDADDNGAYNIARKGLWIIEKIKNTPDDEIQNIKLAISNKEWLNFAQKLGEEYN